MKLFKMLFVLSLIVLFTGCSHTRDDNDTSIKNPSPSGSDEPSSTLEPSDSPTQEPEETLSPTSEPSPTTTNAPTKTEPEATPTPVAGNKGSASDLLSHMSLEEKIGQMFFVRCNNETAKNDINKYHLGGFILFANDFEGQTKSSMKNLINGYQEASELPMLIGVDEEGGMVNRISKYPAFRAVPFKSPQELFQLGGFQLVKTDTIEKAILLKSMGINVNLAPVCDVSTNPKDFIYGRSFGKNPANTADYVKTVVKAMGSQDIGSTLKHFPGYGNNVDTHTGIAVDNRTSKSFYNNDFIPFQAGINAGAGSILVCHNIVKAFDPDYPASLSPAVHKILRQDLHFNGVIMTDDLSMDAIKEYTNNEEAAVLAVKAGNDLLIASDYTVQIPAVIAAVKNKEISMERINESVLRILKWKASLGILSE